VLLPRSVTRTAKDVLTSFVWSSGALESAAALSSWVEQQKDQQEDNSSSTHPDEVR